MHELSVVQEIIKVVEDERTRQGFNKVSLIRIRAGALSGIQPESLLFAFEVAREGTCAARAELALEVEPMQLLCRQCNQVMSGRGGPQKCSFCGARDLSIQAGSNLDIISLEVD
jgi:hydrogenase nickel incorporation protein HypA/HybF